MKSFESFEPFECHNVRGLDSRSRTRQSLTLDCESCPIGGFLISYTRNNELDAVIRQ